MKDLESIPQVVLVFLRFRARIRRLAIESELAEYDKELARRERLVSEATDQVEREKRESRRIPVDTQK